MYSNYTLFDLKIFTLLPVNVPMYSGELGINVKQRIVRQKTYSGGPESPFFTRGLLM